MKLTMERVCPGCSENWAEFYLQGDNRVGVRVCDRDQDGAPERVARCELTEEEAEALYEALRVHVTRTKRKRAAEAREEEV